MAAYNDDDDDDGDDDDDDVHDDVHDEDDGDNVSWHRLSGRFAGAFGECYVWICLDIHLL